MVGIYKHYKGGMYNVVGLGRHTETEEELVIYEDAIGNLWARPLEMFMDKVEVNGVMVPRFERSGDFFKQGVNKQWIGLRTIRPHIRKEHVREAQRRVTINTTTNW